MSPRRALAAGIAAVVVAGATACGRPPTNSARGGGAASGSSEAFTKVYDQLNGLSGRQRTDRLAQLAKAEGKVVIYTSNNTLPKVLPAFEKAYGITTEVYRAQSQTVAQRAHSEAAAGRVGSDIVDNTAEYQLIEHDQGVLTEYRGPVRDTLPAIAKGVGFTANQYTIFATSWNTDRVAAADRPSSYEDLADPRWKGRLLIDPRHDAMYYALHEHFVGRQGWSEDRFRDLFREIGKNAVHMEGGTERANAVASGEHLASLGSFVHEVEGAAKKGAPIDWRPAVQPMYVEPVGSALTANARHPAAALLFYEWVLTAGQAELAKLGRVTNAEMARGGRLAGMRLLTIDYRRYVAERTRWEQEFHRLIGYR
ncbi:ABC transporter substrate-binding protein [Actinomadura sp. SCN-SB]|uniref:ABC transporter substrate-binding protein n=1 Tax=Actinomadura sp. SCN-SB TaxID=3373092 RepID=UPI003752E104